MHIIHTLKRINLHIYIYTHIYIYIYIHIYIYGHALRGPPPRMVWEAAPLPPPVVWALVGLISNPPPSPLWCGVWWVGIPSLLPPLWWGRLRVGKSWWGRIRGPSRVGSAGGREASLVRQTIFCGRRFCSEVFRQTLGTIQCRVIESVPMISRPAIVYCTLCYILYNTLYTLEFILCTID